MSKTVRSRVQRTDGVRPSLTDHLKPCFETDLWVEHTMRFDVIPKKSHANSGNYLVGI